MHSYFILRWMQHARYGLLEKPTCKFCCYGLQQIYIAGLRQVCLVQRHVVGLHKEVEHQLFKSLTKNGENFWAELCPSYNPWIIMGQASGGDHSRARERLNRVRSWRHVSSMAARLLSWSIEKNK